MKKAKRTLQNGCKNAVLVLLVVALAALTVLSWDTGLAAGGVQPPAWLKAVSPLGDGGYVQRAGEAAAAYPVRIAVTSNSGLVGAAYQEAAVSALYETVRPLWAEALTQAQPFAVAEDTALRTALLGQTMLLEYAGRVPVSLLSGWLGGTVSESGTLCVGTLVLTRDGSLFVRDAADGKVYRAQTQVDGGTWEQIAGTVTAGDCAYAGTLSGGAYEKLRPETLVMQETAALPIFSVRAPNYWKPDSNENLQRLLEAFGYDKYLKSYAENGGETQVFVGDYSSLRVARGGAVRFQSTSLTNGLFAYQAEEAEGMSAVAAQVDFAQKLLGAAMRSVDPNNASFALRTLTYDVENSSCLMTFGQTLGGVPLAGRELARFTFSGGLLTSAQLQLRVYAGTGEKLYVLPLAQTAAAAPPGEHNSVVAYRTAEDGRVLAQAYLE